MANDQTAGQVYQFTNTFRSAGACVAAGCGVHIVLPEWYYTERQRDHKSFYCPNGHPQYFAAKSAEEVLREEVERKNKQLQYAQERESALRQSNTRLTHQLNGTKGALVKVKKRIGRGVCPACNRTFPNVADHMKCKHPEYVDESK